MNFRIGFFILLLVASYCTQQKLTPFEENRRKDSGRTLSTEEWRRLLGQEKANILLTGIGLESLNALSYGAGVSNIVQLVNAVSDANKLVALIGNDGPPATGLGVVRILRLLLETDAAILSNMSANLPVGAAWNAPASPPADNDTIANIASLVNSLTLAEIQNLIIPLMGGPSGGTGLDISRGMQNAQDTPRMQRMARILAHVDSGTSSCVKICDLLKHANWGATPDTTKVSKLGALIKDTTNADRLIEALESVSTLGNMVTVIKDVSDVSKLVAILNTVTNATKVGYIVNQVSSLSTLIAIIDNISSPTRLGQLINKAEDGSTWTGQIGGPQTWAGSATTKGNPHSANSAVPRLVATINNLTDSAEDSDTTSDYQKLIALIDGISDMDKLVRLIQDVNTIGDVTTLLNSMSALSGTSGYGVTGSWTTASGCTTPASGTYYGHGGKLVFMSITNGGSGCTNPTFSFTPAGTGASITATISGGAITNIIVHTDVGKLASIINEVSLANIPRLRRLVDGRRLGADPTPCAAANAAQQSSYLGKLQVLISNLDPLQEGTIKTRDIINGVTNVCKVVDLINDVTLTTNLSAIINGIFKASEVDGCSDGVPGHPTQAACEAAGHVWGAPPGAPFGRKTAVVTLVYLIENVADPAKLVSMINNISPTNIRNLVNIVAVGSQKDDANNNDEQAAGKKLAKVVDNVTNINQLNFLVNQVSSINKMGRLINFMDIGATATQGTGKLAALINGTLGPNNWNAAAGSRQNATGMGKLVNLIDYVRDDDGEDAMQQLATLLKDVTDIQKIVMLTNGVGNSSNLVGLINAVLTNSNGANVNLMVNLLNTLQNTTANPDMKKLAILVNMIGNAAEVHSNTNAHADHTLIAQLLPNPPSTYNHNPNSLPGGLGTANLSALIGQSAVNAVANCTGTPSINFTGCATAPTATAIMHDGGLLGVRLTSGGAGCGATVSVTISGLSSCTPALQQPAAIVSSGSVSRLVLNHAVGRLAHILTSVDKGANAINYNSTGPNISTREAMVRMIVQTNSGVRHNSGGYTTAPIGYRDYPGIGVSHLAQAVLNNLSAASVDTVVNMLNSDTTNLTDLVVLIGCGDHLSPSIQTTYNPLPPNFQPMCQAHSPSLW